MVRKITRSNARGKGISSENRQLLTALHRSFPGPFSIDEAAGALKLTRFPGSGVVRCYSFEELFAEKIRAMKERCRPRDLYDIINLFRRPDLRAAPDLIREVLEEKCRSKNISVPTFSDLETSPHREELISEWENMLRHQLPALPPLEARYDYVLDDARQRDL